MSSVSGPAEQRDVTNPTTTSLVDEIVDQFRLLSEGCSLLRSEFTISPQQYEAIEARLRSDPSLQAVADTARYDYNSRTGYFAIRVVSAPHQKVVLSLVDTIQAYVESAKNSSDPKVNAAAKNVRVDNPQTLKYKIPKDADYKPKDVMPRDPNAWYQGELLPIAQRHRTRSETAKSVADATASNRASGLALKTPGLAPEAPGSAPEAPESAPEATGSASTGDSDYSTKLSKYMPDACIYCELGDEDLPTVAIEIARTQQLPNLKSKVMTGFNGIHVNAVLAIDIDSQAEFEGEKLERGAVYIYLWRCPSLKELRGDEFEEEQIKPAVWRKILGPRPEGKGAQREMHADFIYILNLIDMVSEEEFSEDIDVRKQEVLALNKHGRVRLSVEKLREAIERGERRDEVPVPEPWERKTDGTDHKGFLLKTAASFPDEVTED